MKRTTYQVPEIRDENDNIIQDGTFGKHSAFSNATNDGAFDYILNNLEALRDNINGSRIYVKNKDALTTPGDISAMYIAEDTGKWYLWDGNKYIETDNARKIADEAIAARDAAKASQTAAKTSEQNAKTSETNAAASAKAAANSAKAAATSEANAKTSETHAASSETNAASYLAQAQTIKEAVDGALGKVTSAMKYAGSVNTYADLPTANRNPGDVYNVKTADSTHGIKAGENVAWNGTDWDPLGGTVDLSPYATNTSVAGAFMNVTYSNATLNFVKKDGSTVSVTVNNVAHATSADSATSATSATSAAKATADANGNNIGNTYVKKTDVANAVTTATLTVTGAATAPTAVEGTEDNSVATTKFVAKSIASLVNGAPDQLNTLNELAKALGNDSNFAATMTAELAKKLNSAEAESTYATKQEAQEAKDIAEYGFLKRNTAYKVGDIAYTTQLPAGYYLECVTAGTTGNTEPTISVGSENVNDGTVKWGVKNIQDASKSGLPVGFEAFTTNPTLQAGWLPLLGGEYSRTTYADLWAWVQTQNGYLLEESAWQAKATANGGNVPYYSSGDGSTTFRVPSLKCWVKGANSISEVGGYLAAGLPNITGSTAWAVNGTLGTYSSQGNPYHQNTGALSVETDGKAYGAIGSSGNDSENSNVSVNIDASRSSAIYGNSSTVQPESIVGMWVVKAYGTVTNVGSTDVANISTGLTQAETRIGAAETRISTAETRISALENAKTELVVYS